MSAADIPRRDDLAATVARNLQHMGRLGTLYRTARDPEIDAARLRADLVEAASFAGPTAAAISTGDQAEQFAISLRGLIRLVLQPRDALEGGRDAT
jgi:hypothetical protein